jgi:putative nucleotidyltransferase with HDIG domain
MIPNAMAARDTPPRGAGERSDAPSKTLEPMGGRPRVLLVDDEPDVIRAHERILGRLGLEVVATTSPAAALSLLSATRFDLLIADVRMPEISGLDLAREASLMDPELAIIMLSGVNDAATATQALRNGAMDYLTKPITPDILETTVRSSLRRRALLREQRRVERLVREEVSLRTAELEREKLSLREMTVNVAESLITAMEAKDVYLRGHSHRVAALAAAMAEDLGLDADQVETIRLAGRLHDVGKIGIQESVLNKPGGLTPDEYAHVKQHVQIGMQILAPLTHLGAVLTYVHHHHEHWDGSGYPQGIAGDAISLGGRILTAADAYDALTSARAYRAPHSRDDALAMLVRSSGKLLDPEVLAALEHVVLHRQSLVFLDTN